MKKVLLILLLTVGLMAGELENDKNIGFALNPLFLLSAGTMMSGGASYFNHERGFEIAVPFFYYTSDEGDDDAKPDSSYVSPSVTDDEFTQLNIDVHYRHYHDRNIGGLYYGALARYTYLDGKLKDEHMRAKVRKVGFAAELGYRSFGLFGYKQLYWGASVALGAYTSDKHDQFEEPMLGDSIALVDVEFFKFGVTF